MMNPVKLGSDLEGLDYDNLTKEERNTLSSKYGQLIKRGSNAFLKRVAEKYPNLILSDILLEKLDGFCDIRYGQNFGLEDDWYSALENNIDSKDVDFAFFGSRIANET